MNGFSKTEYLDLNEMEASMKELWKRLERYIPFVLWGGILIVFGFTRMWKLIEIPLGLHYDEASMAYSAWSLSRYGVDRYLDSWPVYMKNFGGGQSVLYAYLMAGLFKLFGFHVVLIRIPSVLFSLLALGSTVGIAKIIFPEHKYAPYIAGAFMAIGPYYIMAGRLGLDCNLMLGGAALFLYCFLKAIGTGRKIWYVAAGISGGIMLYTYILSYLMLPVFLLLALFYTILTRKFSFGRWVIMAVPMGILAFPLILEQFVNIFGLESFKLGFFTITRMDSYRVSEFGRFQIASLKVALQDIFVGDIWLHNSIPGIPNLYWLSIPLAVAGLIHVFWKAAVSLRRRDLYMGAFVFCWFISVLFVVCHIYPCVNQVNSIFFSYTLLSIEGIFLFVRLKKFARRIVYIVISVIFVTCFIRFSGYYYGGGYITDNYPMAYFDILTTEALDFIEEHPQYGARGVQMAEPPVYLGLSTLWSPYELCLFDQDLYVMDYYHCSHLGEIEEGYYYIVRDTFHEYANELRSKGYVEISYNGYSLFYLE